MGEEKEKERDPVFLLLKCAAPARLFMYMRSERGKGRDDSVREGGGGGV